MAAKLGAEPWRVQIPPQKWMVCGYDTYHDARQRKAVGAFVGSINQSFTRYCSSVVIHENNEEISAGFRKHLTNCLRYRAQLVGSNPTSNLLGNYFVFDQSV